MSAPMLAPLQAPADIRIAPYSANHPESPLALAWDAAGPVKVQDRERSDVAHAVSRKDWRRAYALGLISVQGGMAPDRHQTYTGLWLDDCANPADYLARWIETGCRWRDAAEVARADGPEPEPEPCELLAQYAAELASSTDTPQWWLDWAGRLVYQPKFDYLVELGAAPWLGAPAPADPGTDWSSKMRAQWARRIRKGDPQ